MTTLDELEALFAYSYWANRQIFAALSKLTDGQFTQNVAGSYGSVRNTLVHTMSAEWGWIERCGGPPRGPKLVPENYPNAEAVIEQWKKVEGYVRDALSHFTDDDLARDVSYSFGGPTQTISVKHLLQHLIVHGAHHRGQVAVLLRLLGTPASNFDILFYYAEPRIVG